MIRYQNTAATAAFSGVAVLLAPALAVATLVAAPVPAQADEVARQFEQPIASPRLALTVGKAAVEPP